MAATFCWNFNTQKQPEATLLIPEGIKNMLKKRLVGHLRSISGYLRTYTVNFSNYPKLLKLPSGCSQLSSFIYIYRCLTRPHATQSKNVFCKKRNVGQNPICRPSNPQISVGIALCSKVNLPLSATITQ